MFLTRLVYTSTITDSFSPSDIELILEAARKNNGKRNVTGMLCFSRKYFLQCLEGSRTQVNQIYQKILNDPRHTNIVLLDYQQISHREFSEWSMSYIPESSLTSALSLKYSGASTFNPYEMSGESAHEMMLLLKCTIPSV
ncbi:BLUF domain-containing protein [Catenovulum sp. SX2]|uniref:BLUF domain-containing protein n=1 Tax=Catenovulum sp. SX2 TaxID=3398614 RepID=UPI003F82E66F